MINPFHLKSYCNSPHDNVVQMSRMQSPSLHTRSLWLSIRRQLAGQTQERSRQTNNNSNSNSKRLASLHSEDAHNSPARRTELSASLKRKVSLPCESISARLSALSLARNRCAASRLDSSQKPEGYWPQPTRPTVGAPLPRTRFVSLRPFAAGLSRRCSARERTTYVRVVRLVWAGQS